MDPNEALRRAREAANEIAGSERSDRESEHRDDVATELAEYFQALDGWISRGGFLPEAWAKAQKG